jgi:hypothetical protein
MITARSFEYPLSGISLALQPSFTPAAAILSLINLQKWGARESGLALTHFLAFASMLDHYHSFKLFSMSLEL